MGTGNTNLSFWFTIYLNMLLYFNIHPFIRKHLRAMNLIDSSTNPREILMTVWWTGYEILGS